jgi:hypothetical protein
LRVSDSAVPCAYPQAGKAAYTQPQQTGMLFIITQQVQPDFIIAVMQSQHAWIISQHLASPEVHMILHPLSVISQLVMPMVMLQQQTIIPFIIMQQLTIEPVSIEQRFFIMLAAMASSQVHVMVMPVLVFSSFIVQRGTIIMFGMVPAVPPIVPMPVVMPGIAIPARSIIIMLMAYSSRVIGSDGPGRHTPEGPGILCQLRQCAANRFYLTCRVASRV